MLTIGENYIGLRVLHHIDFSGTQECETFCNILDSGRQTM